MPPPSATEERNIYVAHLIVAAGSGLPCLGLCSPICRGRILATWHRVTFYNEASWSFVQVREVRGASGQVLSWFWRVCGYVYMSVHTGVCLYVHTVCVHLMRV